MWTGPNIDLILFCTVVYFLPCFKSGASPFKRDSRAFTVVDVGCRWWLKTMSCCWTKCSTRCGVARITWPGRLQILICQGWTWWWMREFSLWPNFWQWYVAHVVHSLGHFCGGHSLFFFFLLCACLMAGRMLHWLTVCMSDGRENASLTYCVHVWWQGECFIDLLCACLMAERMLHWLTVCMFDGRENASLTHCMHVCWQGECFIDSLCACLLAGRMLHWLAVCMFAGRENASLTHCVHVWWQGECFIDSLCACLLAGRMLHWLTVCMFAGRENAHWLTVCMFAGRENASLTHCVHVCWQGECSHDPDVDRLLPHPCLHAGNHGGGLHPHQQGQSPHCAGRDASVRRAGCSCSTQK